MEFKRIAVLIALLFAATCAHAQCPADGSGSGSVTVSGNLKDLGGVNAGSRNSFVRFTLTGYGSDIPRVITTNAIAAYCYDLHPNSSGVISGTIQGNDTIQVGGNPVGGTYYQVCIYFQNQIFACDPYTITGSSFNLNSATPNSTNPVVPAPQGDTTYLRLDAGNSPVTGTLTISGVLHPSGGLGGTIPGSPTFSGSPAFSSLTNGDCMQAGAGGTLGTTVLPCPGPASSISAEFVSPYASPSASAATNTSAINNALANSGTVTLTKCGTYNVNGNFILTSNTRFSVAPCVTLIETGSPASDFIENHAFANRGALVTTATVTFNSSGSTLSGCSTGTQTVTFNNNGGAQQAQGTVTVSGASGPTNGAAVTITQAGGMYTAAPTQGTVSSCSGTGNFNGATITGAATAVTISYTSPNTTATVSWTNWNSAPFNLAVGLPVYLAGVATSPYNVPSAFSGVFTITTPTVSNTSFTITLDHLPASSFSGTVYAIPADYNIIVEGGQWNYNNPTNGVTNDLKANAFNFGAVQAAIVRDVVCTLAEKYCVFLSAARDSETRNVGAPVTNSDIVKLECSLKNVHAYNTWGRNGDDGVSWMNWGGSFYDAWCAGDVQNTGIDGTDITSTAGSALAVAYFSAPYYTGGTFIRNIHGKPNGYGVLVYGYQSTTPTLDSIEIDNVPAGNGSVSQVGTLGTCSGSPGTCPYTINSIKLHNIPLNTPTAPLWLSDSNAVFNNFQLDGFSAINTGFASAGFAAVGTADGIYNNCEISNGTINIGSFGYFWQFANSGSLQAVTNCAFHNIRMFGGKAVAEVAGGLPNPAYISLRDSFVNSTIGLDIRSGTNIVFEGDTFGSSATSGSVNVNGSVTVNIDDAGSTTWAVSGQNGIWQVAAGSPVMTSKTPCVFNGVGVTVSGFSASTSTPAQNVCTGFFQTGSTPGVTGTLTFPFTAPNAWECDLHVFNASGANFPGVLVETGNSSTSWTTQSSSFSATGITQNTPSAGQATIAGVFAGINGGTTSAQVSGFTNGGNNGTFTVLTLGAGSIVVSNSSAVTESHAATVVSDFPLSNIYVYRCSQR